MEFAKHFSELRIYQRAFQLTMEIFEQSKRWPAEERYSLTDQARRSSRAVCANLAEAWKKRRYPNHFISKLTDADAEAGETQNWLGFAQGCGYLSETDFRTLWDSYGLVSRGLANMISHPEQWCGTGDRVREEQASYNVDPDPNLG